MSRYDSIKDIEDKVMEIIPEYMDLLELLEEVNPCEQSYDLKDHSLVVSYMLKLNLFNFFGKFSLYKRTRIIGLPISICDKGYFGEIETIEDIIQDQKGLTILLNGDQDLGCESLTLSTFILDNQYHSFQDYLDRLRSPYRRRIIKALDKRDRIIIKKLEKADFTETHYSLYRSVLSRSENPLEILPLAFFKSYDADIYEITARDTDQILAFFQLKQFGDCLYFLFCGFNKEDNALYDLYYNLLINIVEIGIERGVGTINFGQTSEESKLKIGCKEERKYLWIHHSHPVLNKILQFLLPMFSYKPYPMNHNVLKKE